jgi:hypothetical protein
MKRRSNLWIIFFGVSCQTSFSPEDPTCDPRELTVDEVRFRPLLCGEEYIRQGDSRRGDWLLENNLIRLTIRDIGTSLTSIDGSGGSIVDIARPNGVDGVLEIVPWDGQAIELHSMTVQESESGITLEYNDGDFSISLAANEQYISFVGENDWMFHPLAGTALFGQMIIPPHNKYVYATDATIIDNGGSLLLLEPTTLTIGEAEEVFEWINDSQYLEGEADGEQLLLYQEEQLLGFLPIIENSYAGFIPLQSTHYQIQKSGCQIGSMTLIGESISPIESCGSILIRLQDEQSEVAGILRIQNEYNYIPKGGIEIPWGNYIDTASLYLGPAYETITISNIDPTSNPNLEYYVQRIIPREQLFQPLNLVSPDQSVRIENQKVIQRLIGEHTQYGILSANDTIPNDDEIAVQLDNQIQFDIGLRSNTDNGFVLSWPWSRNLKEGFGALPASELSPIQLIAASQKQLRSTAVEWSLWKSIERDDLWEPPNFIIVNNDTEMQELLQEPDLLSKSSILGPYTWIPNLSDTIESKLETLQNLYYKQTTAGNGPYVSLQILRDTPRNITLKLSFSAPYWMNVETIALYSEEGIIQQWPVTTRQWEKQITIQRYDKLILACWGSSQREWDSEVSWAITRPEWTN